MKSGDLVMYDTYTEKWAVGVNICGIIIETGVYTGRKDVKVMWQDGSIRTDKSRRLEVISENKHG
jgi:hypothetical protein